MGIGTGKRVARKVSGTGANFDTKGAGVAGGDGVATGILFVVGVTGAAFYTVAAWGVPLAMMSYCVSVPARE